MRKKQWIRIAWCACLGVSLLRGQTAVQRLQSDRIGVAGFCYERWTAEKDKVSEWSVPVTVFLPVGGKAGLYAVTAPAVGSALEAGAEYALTGMADLKCGGHVLLLNDRALLTLGVNLPTGKASLKTGEYSVASVLAMPAFQFRFPTLGQGLDLQVGLSGAAEVAGAVIGFGASFLKKGGYQPFEGVDATYDPGDEISVSAGAEKEAVLFAKNVKLTADAMYSLYFDDTWGGRKVFRSGNRLLLQARAELRIEPFDVTLLVRDRIKARNGAGSGDVIELEGKNRNGSQFEALGIASRAPNPTFAWRGLVALRRFSVNDYGTGGASLFGFGAGMRKQLSHRMTLDAEGRYYTGSIKAGRKDVSAAGISLTAGVEIRL
jgi:hypothetical protein